MKILILIEYNPYFVSSAAANRWRSLIDGLSASGVDIELVITNGYASFEEYRKFHSDGVYKRIKYRYLILYFHHNIWLRRINRYFLKSFIKNVVNRRVLNIVKQNPDAIVWTSNAHNHFELAYSIKKKMPKAKTFLEMSEFLDIHHINKGRSLHKIMGDNRQLFFEQRAFYAYNGLALMTRTLLKHYHNFSKEGPKLLHLPMTVDLKRFDPNLSYPVKQALKTPYIAFVGVMNNKKDGVDILIDAFSIIANEFLDLNLYLFGFYHHDTPGQLNQIKKLDLEGRVYYMGAVPSYEIPEIIMNASLLVLPRPDSKQAQGGFPTKLGEYLASGNPVCVTKVGEIPDYLKDEVSAFMSEPGNIESFADSMRRALLNKELSRKVGANGRKVAETHFNMNIQAKKLYDFLKEL